MFHVPCYVNNVFIKINRWEEPFLIQASVPLSTGDVIIVELDEGIAPAIVGAKGGQKELKEKNEKKARFLRKANLNDLKVIKEHQKRGEEALKICRQEVKRTDLPMKVVDATYSFDRGSITFAFIADGRIDFRELVKNLSKKFQRSVRLHQIGARDESRQGGGFGICGRELCCVRFKRNLPSITSEMAKVQQIAHRGSERISGVCGRLMCCLAYEADQYRELLESFPQIGAEIRHKGKKGIVREISAMTGEVKIELEDRSILFVNKEELK